MDGYQLMSIQDKNPKLEELIKTVPSAKDLEAYSYSELRIAMHYAGIYGLPTQELITFCKHFLKIGSAIEIGSGTGMFGKALGIPCTDNLMQNRPDVKLQYERIGQPTIEYGEHVEELEAEEAVAFYKPNVVFSSWITPKLDRDGQPLNTHGTNENAILNKVDAYIQLMADTHIRMRKPILELPHIQIRAPWIYGRSENDNFIGIWTKKANEAFIILKDIEMDFALTVK